METVRSIYALPSEKVEFNEGQIEGLPKNPRFWTQEELDNLIASIKEDPQLLEMRGLIVLEDPSRPGRYVTLGGNMRLAALREIKAVTVPAMIAAPDTDPEELRRIVMKDNGHLGSYDTDEVANYWGAYVKPEWGAPIWLSELAQAGEAAGEGGEGGADLNLDLNGGGSLKKELSEAGGMFQVSFAFPIEFRDDIEGYIGINTKEVLRDKIIEICRGVEAK